MKSRRRNDAAAELEAVASVVQRLAVLLAAGVPPLAAWGYLSDEEGSAEETPDGGSVTAGVTVAVAGVVTEVVALAKQGVSVDEGIVEVVRHTPGVPGLTGWLGLAAAWRVATDAGAPLASTLTELAHSLRDLAQTARDVQVALAGPVATARMVLALPAVGVLFGAALGFDTLGTLFTTPAGFACLIGGVGLMLAAQGWNRRLIRSATPAVQSPGLALDLVAVAVSGGASTDRATLAVEQACERSLLPIEQDRAAFEGVFSLSRRAGVPAASLLRSEAAAVRRRARSDGARKAATLSVTLMLPLGLCILPAFMLLGVAPLLIAVISSTVSTF